MSVPIFVIFSIIAFFAVHPDPSGNIYFSFSFLTKILSDIISFIFELFYTIINSLIAYPKVFISRFELNVWGCIWKLFLDLLGLIPIILILLFLWLAVYSTFDYIYHCIKNKEFIIIVKKSPKIFLSIIPGLIIGSIAGIIIKPHIPAFLKSIWVIIVVLYIMYSMATWKGFDS